MLKLLKLIIITIVFSSTAHALPRQNYSQVFKNYRGCFLLYNLTQQKMISEYNPHDRCDQRIAADSSFKIALSLMAFNQNIIHEDTVFKWDGKQRGNPEWDQDQTPQRWLQYSVVWVSQQITPQLGMARIKQYLADFNYGNQDFSGDPGKNNGLTYAWLSSSLKISAMEQLHFLTAMLNNKLPVTAAAIANTKKNLYLGKLDNGVDYYGKTGSGRNGHNEREKHPSKLRDGWFVGFVENHGQEYIFVSNLTDKAPASTAKTYGSTGLQPSGSKILKPITLQLLNAYFA